MSLREDPTGEIVRTEDGFLAFKTHKSLAAEKDKPKAKKTIREDPKDFEVITTEDGFRALRVKRSPEEQAKKDAEAPKELSVKELKAIAKERGLKVPSKATKEEIAALLKEADDSDVADITDEE